MREKISWLFCYSHHFRVGPGQREEHWMHTELHVPARPNVTPGEGGLHEDSSREPIDQRMDGHGRASDGTPAS